MTKIKRGEVYWLTIKKDSVQHKQSGRRPVIIMQSDELNDSNVLTTLIVPTTAKERGNDFDNLELTNTETPEPSVALCSNLQIIDRYRIKKSDYICDVDNKDMDKINKYLKNVLGIEIAEETDTKNK